MTKMILINELEQLADDLSYHMIEGENYPALARALHYVEQALANLQQTDSMEG